MGNCFDLLYSCVLSWWIVLVTTASCVWTKSEDDRDIAFDALVKPRSCQRVGGWSWVAWRARWLMPRVSVYQPSPVGSAQQLKVNVGVDWYHVDQSHMCWEFVSRGWDRWYRFVKDSCGLRCWDLMWKVEALRDWWECWEMTGWCALKSPCCNPARPLLSAFTTCCQLTVGSIDIPESTRSGQHWFTRVNPQWTAWYTKVTRSPGKLGTVHPLSIQPNTPPVGAGKYGVKGWCSWSTRDRRG